LEAENMKMLNDAAMLEHLVDSFNIRSFFDTKDLDFCAYQYQKGEVLCSPMNPVEHLLFLVEGSVQMYDLHPDGSSTPVATLSDFTMIGDMEYITARKTHFFLEAAEDCICVALPIEPYREELEEDVTFLHCLLDNLADKFEYTSQRDIIGASLEERLLTYLREDTEDHELKEVEGALYQLRCSRRQLQRVLKKLCEEGTLARLGKGHYKLTESLKQTSP
jgi:CRP-like cAMP-binding protein